MSHPVPPIDDEDLAEIDRGLRHENVRSIQGLDVRIRRLLDEWASMRQRVKADDKAFAEGVEGMLAWERAVADAKAENARLTQRVAYLESLVAGGADGAAEAIADLRHSGQRLEGERERLIAEYGSMAKERDASRDVMYRLNRDRVLTCVYCGQAYPPGTPDHGAEVLTAHVRVCEKHPMRGSEAERDTWKSRAMALVTATENLVRLYRSGETIMPPDVIREANQIEKVHAELRDLAEVGR